MNRDVLVDSNILVYAINDSSPKQHSAQKFLKDNSGKLIVTAQNILETVRVLTHPKFTNSLTPPKALDLVNLLTDNFRLIVPTQQTLYGAIELIKKYKLSGDKVFDAYLASTAITNDIKYIATDNTKDFKMFNQLKVINPFAILGLV